MAEVAKKPADLVNLISESVLWAVMWACHAIKFQLMMLKKDCPIWTLMVSIMKLQNQLERYQGATQSCTKALEAECACKQDISILREQLWESLLTTYPDIQSRNRLVDAPEVLQHLLKMIGVDCDLFGAWRGASIVVGTLATEIAPHGLNGTTTHNLIASIIWRDGRLLCIKGAIDGVTCHEGARTTKETFPVNANYVLPLYVINKHDSETWLWPDPDLVLRELTAEFNVAEFKREQAEKEALALAIKMSIDEQQQAPPAGASVAADAATVAATDVSPDGWAENNDDYAGWGDEFEDE